MYGLPSASSWKCLSALPAGALPALAFPAPALWWLAPVALVPWLLLARSAPTGRSAALTGWLGGMGLLLALHHWLLPHLHLFILVLSALLGMLWAPWGWTARRLLRDRPRPASFGGAVLLLPSMWLLAELVRSWEYLGGPWGLLGATQWQVPAGLRLVSAGGVWLVGFLLVAVNTAVVALLVVPTARRAAVGALAGVGTLTGITWLWAPAPERTGDVRVAVVQPGVHSARDARITRSEELTRRAASTRPDLVVWGESSVGYDLAAYPRLRQRLARLSAHTGAPLLVNVDAPRVGAAEGRFKSSVLIGPDGPVGRRYDKMRLVPFGEYVPAREILGWATSVGRAAKEDRLRGSEPVLMRAGGTVTGPLICFETAFPDMSRRLVRDGAELLVAQSATSSFQDSWAPQQHASLAALRAAETGRPVVHATLTGTSAVYGPQGDPVGGRLETGRSAVSVREVPIASGTTWYVRFGDWPLGLAVLFPAVFFTAETVRALRARRPAAVGTDLGDPRPTPP